MDRMTKWFEDATSFFHACEAAKGWDNCKQYVADGAVFICQSESYAEVKTVEGYATKIALVYDAIFRDGVSYELELITHNDDGVISFFGTSIVKHTGPGGPVPPNGNVAHIHFAYFITPDQNGKVARMIKVFDQSQSRKQLGWP